jgi:hypothetical protein
MMGGGITVPFVVEVAVEPEVPVGSVPLVPEPEVPVDPVVDPEPLVCVKAGCSSVNTTAAKVTARTQS